MMNFSATRLRNIVQSNTANLIDQYDTILAGIYASFAHKKVNQKSINSLGGQGDMFVKGQSLELLRPYLKNFEFFLNDISYKLIISISALMYSYEVSLETQLELNNDSKSTKAQILNLPIYYKRKDDNADILLQSQGKECVSRLLQEDITDMHQGEHKVLLNNKVKALDNDMPSNFTTQQPVSIEDLINLDGYETDDLLKNTIKYGDILKSRRIPLEGPDCQQTD